MSALLFRHSYALRWLDHGGSVTKLAKVLGHNSLQEIAKYVERDDEDPYEEAARLFKEWGFEPSRLARGQAPALDGEAESRDSGCGCHQGRRIIARTAMGVHRAALSGLATRAVPGGWQDHGHRMARLVPSARRRHRIVDRLEPILPRVGDRQSARDQRPQSGRARSHGALGTMVGRSLYVMDDAAAFGLLGSDPQALIVNGRREEAVMVRGYEPTSGFLELDLRTRIGEPQRHVRVHRDKVELAP